jgi:hypothetical protein
LINIGNWLSMKMAVATEPAMSLKRSRQNRANYRLRMLLIGGGLHPPQV